MKSKTQRLSVLTALLAAGTLAVSHPAHATNYAGNGSSDWGGHVGTGTLTVTDDGTNLTFTVIANGGNLGGNCLAIYIDTGTGGFSSTSGFLDNSDGGHVLVAGYNGAGSQSVINFMSGFNPAYAISMADSTTWIDYTSLFKLANGGTGSFTWLTGQNANPLTLVVPAADLGLTPGVTATIRVFGSQLSTTAWRSSEAIAGNDSGVDGYNTFTQTAYDTYVFAAPSVPTNMVTFSVDMTEQVTLGTFNPGGGDTVYVEGTFQSSPWAVGFPLTNNLSAANTNIYTGTYPDNNAAGTVEDYKYNFYSVASSATTWETITTIVNRYFTLASGEVLPTSYFSNVPASPSATTNTVVFQIDLGPQVYLGNFNPANGDQIEVFGSFDGQATWPAGFILTNNGSLSGNASNLYSGSFTDGNYPGTEYQYKYVIVNGTTDSYESTPNRILVTPTTFATLPVAYFNNASNVYATPVTFQVDMSAPIATGNYNFGNGDTVSAAGTFQSSLSANQWKPGAFVLTNNASAANTNIFTGTFVDANPPGTPEQYKFTINPGGNGASAVYESSANRLFTLGSTAQTLPLVYWNNEDPNNVLLGATLITFTVNMANAVDDFGWAFLPSSDVVVVNGDFLNPQWPNFWADALLGGLDYPQNVLAEVGLSTLYTNTFSVPAGNSLEVQYKYGIIHQFTGTSNTNCDNEAGFAQNHTRYIRATGSYNFPVDIFGQQQTNVAAATEPSFGSLAISAPVAGQLPLSWLGRPGVYLQYTTNLTSTNWVQLPATGGANSSSWPQTNGTVFFRLVNP